MLVKRIINKDADFIQNIRKGLNKITDIVAQTLGPGGLPIIIERQGQKLNGDPLGPMITKDGVSVAAECSDGDPVTDLIIQTIKDVCTQTNKTAGDGTTTAIVLGRSILNEALSYMEKNRTNPQEVRRSLEAAATKIESLLDEVSRPCDTLEMMESVATISANGDKKIGQIIRTAFEAVGAEGVVTVDEGSGLEHTLEVVNGYQIKRGAEAQDRFFNNGSGTRFETKNAKVLIYDGKLQEVQYVMAVLTSLFKHSNESQSPMPPIVFMANEFSTDVIQAMLIFKAEQGLQVVAVKGPHTTTVRTAYYDDLAVFLGGNRLGNGNKNLASFELDDLGEVEEIISDKYTTTFFGGMGDEEGIIKRVDQLKAQKALANSMYDSDLLKDRIASLAQGIAKIGVGGRTDVEIKEIYHRIEDAVNAARAAVEQGIVPGGGAALYRISERLESETATVGEMILRNALKAPLEQIAKNLGEDSAEHSVRAAALLGDSKSTFNGLTGQIVDAYEAGIIDPVKVTKTALNNAISIAALLSTCGGAIIIERTRS